MTSYMKMSLCLIVALIIMTFASASRPGEKIHFQESSELGGLDIDERPGQGQGHGNRNHRGRGRGHQKHQPNIPQFEEGIPGEYPIRGPPQAPLVLPSHPGRGVGLQTNKFASGQGSGAQQNVVYPPVQYPVNTPSVQQPLENPYAGNPFLAKIQRPAVIPTNKYNTQPNQGVTNQLPTSDKPVTTTSSYENPRRTDLFYGSNLLEEQTREGKASDTTTDVNFDDRGLFDTAPHCQPGQILVNNKCRVAV